MAIETFTWERQSGSVGKIEYRVREVQFGDGYSQAAADGINTKVQNWPMSFVGDSNTMEPIIDFLDRHAGWKSFWWTPPGTTNPCLFRAKEWTLTSNGAGVYTLSVEFRQVYKP